MTGRNIVAKDVDGHVKLLEHQPKAYFDSTSTHIAVLWAELVSHDTPSSIIDQDVEAIRLLGDLRSDFSDLLPVFQTIQKIRIA